MTDTRAQLIDLMVTVLIVMLATIGVGLVLQVEKNLRTTETSKTQIEQLEQRITTLEQKTINAEAAE